MSVKKFLKSIKFPGLDSVYEVPVTSVNGMTGDVEVSEMLNPIPYDYMPEGYPKKEVGEVTLFDQTITTNANGFCTNTESFDIAVGETYFVYVDGVEYVCTAYSIDMGGSISPVIGNAALAGTSGGNGEPFIILSMNGTLGMSFENAANKEIAFKIVGYGEIITPMSEEFFPAADTFVVDIVRDTSTGAHSTTTTAGEIYEAYIKGRGVVCQIDGSCYPLGYASHNGAGYFRAAFSGVNTGSWPSPKLVIYEIDNDNSAVNYHKADLLGK